MTMTRTTFTQNRARTARGCIALIGHGDREQIGRLAVTVEEGAHMLGVSRATLYKLVMRGEIDSFTVGRARRIAIATLEQYAREPRSA
jgi:excisionase family DNA binding protein